ncbi:MAG: peroxiredoxin family protein, partial [Bryobacteraceae bacterium]
ALVRNDGFALAGLVEAHHGLGEKEKARDAMARLLDVWRDADPGNSWLERARATGVESKPRDASPRPQRNFKQTRLDHLGPSLWESYPAPKLDALDSKQQTVTLDEYRGKNVLLIFYLGEECPHCLEQLVEAGKKKDELGRLNTEVLAISPNASPQGDVPFRLLADPKLENARRFLSYDDFEEFELHSTILIDKQGRVHWARHGGDPFKDFDFLLKEIRRLNSR